MKKVTIYAIIAVLMIVVVGVTIKLAQEDRTATNPEQNNEELVCNIADDLYTDSDDTNPASKIEGRELRLTCETFKEEVENYDGVVLVDMYSPTCSHCQKMGPIVSELASEVDESYKIAKIDVYKYSDVGSFYKIQSVPAFIFFKGGQEVERLVGERTKEELKEKLLSIK